MNPRSWLQMINAVLLESPSEANQAVMARVTLSAPWADLVPQVSSVVSRLIALVPETELSRPDNLEEPECLYRLCLLRRPSNLGFALAVLVEAFGAFYREFEFPEAKPPSGEEIIAALHAPDSLAELAQMIERLHCPEDAEATVFQTLREEWLAAARQISLLSLLAQKRFAQAIAFLEQMPSDVAPAFALSAFLELIDTQLGKLAAGALAEAMNSRFPQIEAAPEWAQDLMTDILPD